MKGIFERFYSALQKERYPRLGGIGVWHKFSSPNSLKSADEICEHCHLLISAVEMEQAKKELSALAEKRSTVDSTWPKPLYRALENKQQSIVCDFLVPSFIPIKSGLDEERWEDPETGLELCGEIEAETSLRVSAPFLNKWEARFDIQDDKDFATHWFRYNHPQSKWAQKALDVLLQVRSASREKVSR